MTERASEDLVRPAPPISEKETLAHLRAAWGMPLQAEAGTETNGYRFPALALLDQKPHNTSVDKLGWGLILPRRIHPNVRKSLEPLIELRKGQAGTLFKDGDTMNVSRDATVRQFLDRNLAGGGLVVPNNLPYYLLIVGDPEEIPWDFQLELDAQYAVGRLHFPKTDGGHDFSAYRRYADAVKRRRAVPSGKRRATFFSIDEDDATRIVAAGLIDTLADTVESWDKWPVERYLRREATKDTLLRILHGDAAPGVLFTAGHGADWPQDRPGGLARQMRYQGGLQCAGEEQWLFADDIDPRADLTGLIPFLFACFSGGVPRFDTMTERPDQTGRRIADRSFVSALPRRLLSLERPPLAVVGHVDRASTTTFDWRSEVQHEWVPGAQGQATYFELALRVLLEGHAVGFAVDFFGQAWMDLTGRVFEHLAKALKSRDRRVSQKEWAHVAALWGARQDARGFTVFGDPAVRFAQG